MTITPYRRHSAKCPHKSERAYKGCRCPMWLERWHHGKPSRKSAHTRSWEQAQKIARDQERKYEQSVLGEKPKPTTVTVEEAATSFMDTKKGEALDKDTLQKHQRMTTLLLDYCRRKDLSFIREVTLPHLAAHRAEWDKTLKSKLSRRNLQGRLTEFFRYCRAARWIDENPAADLGTIKIKKDEQVRTDPFEPEEMQRILAAIEPALESDYTRRRVRALILVQRHAGLSIEDAIILRRTTGLVEGRDKKCRVIADRKKTGAHINNVIPTWVGQELIAAPNSNPKYLLWSGEGDSASTVKYFQKLLKKVFKAAGIPDGHSHRFRDTAAVALLLKGVGIEEVAQFLGDTIPVTARYYAKWNQSRQNKLDESLRAAFEPEPERPVEIYTVQ